MAPGAGDPIRVAYSHAVADGVRSERDASWRRGPEPASAAPGTSTRMGTKRRKHGLWPSVERQRTLVFPARRLRTHGADRRRGKLAAQLARTPPPDASAPPPMLAARHLGRRPQSTAVNGSRQFPFTTHRNP